MSLRRGFGLDRDKPGQTLNRGLPTERLARAVVELLGDGDGGQVLGAVGREVGALGKYWRSRPLVFSLEPRCQGLAGSQK
ncbi:hypothetical protein KNE206_39560 [Kitasatospora sp. NE20-6]